MLWLLRYVRTMARSLRIEYENALYHVTAHSIDESVLFRDAADRVAFLNLLARVCDHYGVSCLAWCLMTNHYHLVLQTENPNLGRAMQYLNSHFAQASNRRHARRGPVFLRRYHPSIIESESYLLQAIRYVLLNPVKAGIVRSPGEWRWSSFRFMFDSKLALGVFSCRDVLTLFGNDLGLAREYFRDWVLAEDESMAVPSGARASPAPDERAPDA